MREIEGGEVMREIEAAFIDGGKNAKKLYVSPEVYAALASGDQTKRLGLPVVDLLIVYDMQGWRLE